MQPLLTQVPPNRLRSIIATFIPVPASRTARDGPAWPVPITIASYLVAIGHTSAPAYSRLQFSGFYEPLRTTCTLSLTAERSQAVALSRHIFEFFQSQFWVAL